jgi:hypothetical protein
MRPNLLLAWSVAAVAGIVAFTGCGRSNRTREPEITGKRSDPPIELRAEWKPGYRYHLRLDMTVTTDSESTAGDDDLHTVILGQEFSVVVTNQYTNGNRRLELEILAIEMQRSKGPQVSLMYDSAMKGEVIDDRGFVPALNAMIGGKVRCTVTPEGRVTSVSGVPDLMKRAGADSPSASRTITRMINGVMVTNVPPPAAAAPPSTNRPLIRRSSTASAIRNLFSTDFFKQLVEFNYLPTKAVRVGDSWKTQREFTFNTTVGRLMVEATTEFAGWQKQLQQDMMTNCARLQMIAELTPKPRTPNPGTNQPPNAPPPGSPFEEGVLNGIIWLNPELQFPVARQIDQSVSYTSGRNTTVRIEGTNRITQRFSKKLDQSLSIRLLNVSPLAGTSAAPLPLEKESPSE